MIKRRLSCLRVVCLCVRYGCGRREAGGDAGDTGARTRLGAGSYVVLRQGASAAAVGPAADGETVLVQDYRYLKEKQWPTFVLVRTRADVRSQGSGVRAPVRGGAKRKLRHAARA